MVLYCQVRGNPEKSRGSTDFVQDFKCREGESPELAGILEMDFAQMEPFPNYKFKQYEGQQLADKVESIRQFGVLLPIILWYNEDGKYIILSGQNCRLTKLGSNLAGKNIEKC